MEIPNTVLEIIIIAATSVAAIIGIVKTLDYFYYHKENKINRLINSEVIKGNWVAIAMKKSRYDSWRYKDFDLIKAAIGGNKSAIEALKIDNRGE